MDSDSLARQLSEQLRIENPELFALMREDSAEYHLFLSRYADSSPDNPERRNFIDTMRVHDSIRDSKIHEWTPGLLSRGTPLELMAASELIFSPQLQGMMVGRVPTEKDTSYAWDAYQLASRAVSLGKPGASEIARLALGFYAMNHGKRVNSDSIINSLVGNKRSQISNRKDAAMSPRVADAGWLPSYSAAIAEAKRTGQKIFVDFSGYTCTNARAMEQTIFAREDVKELLTHFVLARLYTDNGTSLDDSNRDLESSRFHTIAQPFYAIVSPSDKILASFPGFTRDAEAFKRFLQLDKKYRWKKG